MESLSLETLRFRRSAFTTLDVRGQARFRAGHLAESGHLPESELRARRSELPPRDTPVLVVGDDPMRARNAAGRLESLGYHLVAWLDARLEDVEGGVADRGQAARLWRPSPFLEQVLPRLPEPRSGARRALDLAAGAGREAVFLAMQGYAVDAWDHDRGALEGAQALASRHGVAIATEVRNLERRDPELSTGRYDLITVFRFLHRPLFPHIERALAPGGALVYETYRRGQERFGRPKHPRFLLDPGELARAFPSLAVELYEELEPDGGPILARLLARRPTGNDRDLPADEESDLLFGA
ncbi:MAG TPA: methyltransferase domain-containing protein [Candidatus Eisenbacteria bacterium]|jgi:SAM-dependent methyltransferase